MKIQFQMYFWELSLQVTQKINFVMKDILHWRNQDPANIWDGHLCNNTQQLKAANNHCEALLYVRPMLLQLHGKYIYFLKKQPVHKQAVLERIIYEEHSVLKTSGLGLGLVLF